MSAVWTYHCQFWQRDFQVIETVNILDKFCPRKVLVVVSNMAEKIPHAIGGDGGFCLRQTGRDPGEYNVK